VIKTIIAALVFHSVTAIADDLPPVNAGANRGLVESKLSTKPTDGRCLWSSLRTTHQVRFVTDNAGVIAFDLPELMGRATWFDVIGNGYEAPKDAFGARGVQLTPEPGKTLRVEVNRTIVARRLGRITGWRIVRPRAKNAVRKWIGANQGFSAAIAFKTGSSRTPFLALG